MFINCFLKYLFLMMGFQRSIQDEINRESRSDEATIIISYLVMFAYVSITLGQYHSCSFLFVSILTSHLISVRFLLHIYFNSEIFFLLFHVWCFNNCRGKAGTCEHCHVNIVIFI